jgi:hypothetical protein
MTDYGERRSLSDTNRYVRRSRRDGACVADEARRRCRPRVVAVRLLDIVRHRRAHQIRSSVARDDARQKTVHEETMGTRAPLKAVLVILAAALTVSCGNRVKDSNPTGRASVPLSVARPGAVFGQKDVCPQTGPGQVRCLSQLVTEPQGKVLRSDAPTGYGPADLVSAYNVPPGLLRRGFRRYSRIAMNGTTATSQPLPSGAAGRWPPGVARFLVPIRTSVRRVLCGNAGRHQVPPERSLTSR